MRAILAIFPRDIGVAGAQALGRVDRSWRESSTAMLFWNQRSVARGAESEGSP
jgi:hypothetical protein